MCFGGKRRGKKKKENWKENGILSLTMKINTHFSWFSKGLLFLLKGKENGMEKQGGHANDGNQNSPFYTGILLCL